MTRRLATVVLHWLELVLLMLLLASGVRSVALSWAFSLCGLAMVALALLGGLMNGPGPKLVGALRQAHPWLSRDMYALLGWASIAVLMVQLGMPLPGPDARQALLTLLGAGLLHGIFNLWRATALNDGALRRMLP